MAKLTPSCKYAQRTDSIYLTIELADVKVGCESFPQMCAYVLIIYDCRTKKLSLQQIL